MKISVLSLILGMEDLLNSSLQIWYSNKHKLSKSIEQLTIRFSRLSISQKLEIMLSRMLRERRMLGLLSEWWKLKPNPIQVKNQDPQDSGRKCRVQKTKNTLEHFYILLRW